MRNGSELPKTLCTDWGWVKERSAGLPHRKSDTANKPIKHLARASLLAVLTRQKEMNESLRRLEICCMAVLMRKII
jgi:hypothetical protein